MHCFAVWNLSRASVVSFLLLFVCLLVYFYVVPSSYHTQTLVCLVLPTFRTAYSKKSLAYSHVGKSGK